VILIIMTRPLGSRNEARRIYVLHEASQSLLKNVETGFLQSLLKNVGTDFLQFA
jgi:hypothetical protein